MSNAITRLPESAVERLEAERIAADAVQQQDRGSIAAALNSGDDAAAMLNPKFRKLRHRIASYPL